jgi:hypothetical protein
VQSSDHTAPASQKILWARRIIGGVAILFLLWDAVIKVLQLTLAVEGTIRLGYPADLVLDIGIIELICLVVYVIPRTSVLGAILLTGYLGGALATHLRLGNPLFTHTLSPSMSVC